MRSVLTFFILSRFGVPKYTKIVHSLDYILTNILFWRYFAFILSCGLYVFVSSYRERIQILWKRKILSSDVSLTSTDPKPVGFLDDSMPQMVHARYKKAVAIKILGDVLSVSGVNFSCRLLDLFLKLTRCRFDFGEFGICSFLRALDCERHRGSTFVFLLLFMVLSSSL